MDGSIRQFSTIKITHSWVCWTESHINVIVTSTVTLWQVSSSTLYQESYHKEKCSKVHTVSTSGIEKKQIKKRLQAYYWALIASKVSSDITHGNVLEALSPRVNDILVCWVIIWPFATAKCHAGNQEFSTSIVYNQKNINKNYINLSYLEVGAKKYM